MKKVLITILLFSISILSFGQKCPTNTISINKKIYTVCYSEKYRNPISVTYKIYKVKSNINRGNIQFYQENGIQTATNNDFKDNVYDKGHMAAAETFSDTDEHMYETFSYLNCAVQHYKLNRGVWKSLEFHERQWSQQDSLFVVNRVIFKFPLHPMKSGAFIPDFFEKSITFLSTKKTKTFRFPNIEPVSNDIDFYLIK